MFSVDELPRPFVQLCDLETRIWKENKKLFYVDIYKGEGFDAHVYDIPTFGTPQENKWDREDYNRRLYDLHSYFDCDTRLDLLQIS